MVTRVSGFQAADGTLFTTLEAALAYEKTNLLQKGVDELLAIHDLTGADIGTERGSQPLKEWLIANSEQLVSALATTEVKVERQPRKPRAKAEAPVAPKPEAPAEVKTEAPATPATTEAGVDPLAALVGDLEGSSPATTEVVV